MAEYERGQSIQNFIWRTYTQDNQAMYSMLYEAFDTPVGGTANASVITYSDPRVQSICQNSTLDTSRQSFISTLQDIVVKLNGIDTNSSGINSRLSGYKTQLVRINDLNDALSQIAGYFNGDANNANVMQNLSDLAIALQQNTTMDPSYLTATQAIITQAEAIIRTLYSLANKLDTMRNHLINFLNINNRSVSFARLLCLKREFLDPTLQSLAATLDSNLQSFIKNLVSWCDQMAGVSFGSGNCSQPAPNPVGSDPCSRTPPWSSYPTVPMMHAIRR